MNKTIFVAVCCALSLFCAAPVCASGGYGGGSGGMMMGGGGIDDYSVAVSLIRQEKYEKATVYLDRALKSSPHNANVLNYLGELYLMMHNSASAKEQLAELTRLCPDGCEERDLLTKAIADYHAAATQPATAQPAVQTAPAQAPETPTQQ